MGICHTLKGVVDRNCILRMQTQMPMSESAPREIRPVLIPADDAGQRPVSVKLKSHTRSRKLKVGVKPKASNGSPQN